MDVPLASDRFIPEPAFRIKHRPVKQIASDQFFTIFRLADIHRDRIDDFRTGTCRVHQRGTDRIQHPSFDDRSKGILSIMIYHLLEIDFDRKSRIEG